MAKVSIELTYSPDDYFEDPYHGTVGGYLVSIDKGKVTVEIAEKDFHGQDTLKKIREDVVEPLFEGVRLQSFIDFELAEDDRAMIQNPDGTTGILLFIPAGVLRLSGSLDLKHTDKEGNVKKDTRLERIQEKIVFAEKVAALKRDDETLQAILRSWRGAIKFPENELVYLYEIREVLKYRFGSEKAAIQKLSFSSTKWKRLGKLANVEPLKEGRHRGIHYPQLRAATLEELAESREITRELIKAYFDLQKPE